MTGLDDYDYLVGLAVDSGDPKTVVVSASSWPYKAYSVEDAESLVYRRTASTQDSDNNNDEEWKVVSKGLPERRGTLISFLAENPKVAGEFYAINNRGIFCSTDSGISWKMLEGLQWPNEYLSQHPWTLAVIE